MTLWRNKLSLILLAAIAVPAGASFAQVQLQQTVTVLGTAAQVCTLGAPAVTAGGTNVGTVSGNTVQIAELSDSSTLSTKSASFNVTFAAFCNFNHELDVSSDRNGLWLDGASGVSGSGFAQGVPYKATINYANTTEVLNATASSESAVNTPIDINHPAIGDVGLHFQIDQGATNAGSGAPLQAGDYEDIIRVTVGPQ